MRNSSDITSNQSTNRIACRILNWALSTYGEHSCSVSYSGSTQSVIRMPLPQPPLPCPPRQVRWMWVRLLCLAYSGAAFTNSMLSLPNPHLVIRILGAICMMLATLGCTLYIRPLVPSDSILRLNRSLRLWKGRARNSVDTASTDSSTTGSIAWLKGISTSSCSKYIQAAKIGFQYSHSTVHGDYDGEKVHISASKLMCGVGVGDLNSSTVRVQYIGRDLLIM